MVVMKIVCWNWDFFKNTTLIVLLKILDTDSRFVLWITRLLVHASVFLVFLFVPVTAAPRYPQCLFFRWSCRLRHWCALHHSGCVLPRHWDFLLSLIGPSAITALPDNCPIRSWRRAFGRLSTERASGSPHNPCPSTVVGGDAVVYHVSQ